MSKYLGFIHYIMFDKIKFQEGLNKELLGIANDSIKEQVNGIGVLEEGELEDIIDSENIHGWLQERVGLVEKRFAKLVYLLVTEDKSNLNKIKELLFNMGKKEETPSTVKGGYELIFSRFLDGMPCDRAIENLEESEESVVIRVNIDMHSDFWEEYNMAGIYWDLRDEYIKGIFENSEYNYTKVVNYLYKIGR